jgi:hypothetical protein
MRKGMAMLASSVLALCISGICATTTTHAQCGCVCVVTCNSVCDYECSGCGLIDGLESARRCCELAHSNTPREPCMQ